MPTETETYRTTPETPPAPKKSFWCRIGLHRWGLRGASTIALTEHCVRPGCNACREWIMV